MKKEKIIGLLILCPLFGVWITEAIFFGGLGLSVPITVLIYYGILLWVSRADSLNTEAAWLSIPVVLLSLSFFLHYNPISQVFTLPTLLAVLFIQTAFIFDKDVKGFLSFRYLEIFLKKIFFYPFSNITAISSSFKTEKPQRASGKILNIIVGLVISVPFVLILLVLFSSADEAYRQALSGITDFIFEKLTHLPLDIFFALFFGVPLFLFLSSSYNVKHQPPAYRKRTLFGNTTILATILVSISLVALSFVIVQFNYLFLNQMPENYVYSRYAREGFFQLTFTSGLLLAIVTFIILLGKRTAKTMEKPINWLVTILCVLNTIILISAAKRMLLYIDVHGLLSMKRVLTLWMMSVIFIGMIGIVIKCFRIKFKLLSYLVIVWVAAVCVMGLVNVDKSIAHYNVRHYLADEANNRVDLKYLRSLSYTVIPEIKYLADNAKDETLRTKAQAAYEKEVSEYLDNRSKSIMLYRLDKKDFTR